MKRLLTILLFCALLCSCAPAEGAAEGLRFTDDLGRTVAVEEPKRVACLLGSFADLWVLAGGEVIAAPDDAWVDFHLPMAADAVNLGSTKSLSLEALLAAEPDFVLASVNTPEHLQWQSTLEAAGIPAAYFDVSDFGDYLRVLELCTAITGRADLYDTHGQALQRQIDECIARAAARGTSPKVLYLRASAASLRAKNSQGSVLGEMLADLGCINIADTDDTLLETLSVEHILMEDPDYIFIVRLGDDEDGARELADRFLRENPALAELTAVKNGRVIFLDKQLYNMKPNARWAEAYLQLEALLDEG